MIFSSGGRYVSIIVNLPPAIVCALLVEQMSPTFFRALHHKVQWNEHGAVAICRSIIETHGCRLWAEPTMALARRFNSVRSRDCLNPCCNELSKFWSGRPEHKTNRALAC